METEKNDRATRKTFQGVVVSDKMDKTRVITVERLVRHRLYDKVLRKKSKFYALDEANASKSGDTVEIMSTRPLSRLKRWRVTRVVAKAG